MSSPLLQRNRQPAQIHIRHQPDLPATQFEHRALLVGQHDRARAAADGEAGARGAVDAGDVGRPFDIADPAAQHRLRSAEHEAVVEAAGGQSVTPAAEVQRAAAARAADDPSRLVDRERHGAAVGIRGGWQGRRRRP